MKIVKKKHPRLFVYTVGKETSRLKTIELKVHKGRSTHMFTFDLWTDVGYTYDRDKYLNEDDRKIWVETEVTQTVYYGRIH